MATADLNDALNVPGRLSWNPTSVSSAYPHGGTALGFVRGVAVRRVEARRELTDEAFGSEVYDVISCGENWALACIFRSYDADAIGVLFPNTSTGTVAKRKIVATPGTNRPGLLLSEKSGKLLFTPLDSDRAPAVLFYKAIPLTDETLEMNKALDKREEYGALFVAVRDSSDRIEQMGLLRDLTLP